MTDEIKKNKLPHYPYWMTMEEYNQCGNEWMEIYNQFLEGIEKMQSKYGGKKSLSIEVSNNSVYNMTLVHSEPV